MNKFTARLPATSANLGPGFDALGLAFSLYLTVEAEQASEFAIQATGRNHDLVAALKHNLFLETYRDLVPSGPALKLSIHNEIPLAMGCGSSAAALLAGVLLADHFGHLHLRPEALLAEACRREGHPDNVAACFHGGMTVSTFENNEVVSATLGLGLPWRLLIALPPQSLATSEARALLPEAYSRADAVSNIGNAALLVAAFAKNRPDLLRAGTRDRIHQPYRSPVCPLLPRLLPLVAMDEVYSVTLSGAGPSVLLICDPQAAVEPVVKAILSASGSADVEVLEARIATGTFAGGKLLKV